MAAGTLMLAGVLQDAGLDPEHRVPHKVWYLMPVIPMLFFAAVAGLFSRRYPGWLAKAGLMLALLGAAASTLALVIWGWFGKTPLAYGISVLGIVVLSAGLGVFGIGAVRHKVLPRWNALPLIIGLLCGLTLVFGRLAPWAPTAILALYASAWIGLGYVLWSDSRGLLAVGD